MKMAGFGHNAPVHKDAGSLILVNKQGRRFHNETTETGDVQHGYSNRGEWFAMNAEVPEFVNVPAYVVFDEKARAAGAVMTTLNSRTPPWSEDNLAELERGWIIRADTIDELARKLEIPELPGVARAGRVPAAQLAATPIRRSRAAQRTAPDAQAPEAAACGDARPQPEARMVTAQAAGPLPREPPAFQT